MEYAVDISRQIWMARQMQDLAVLKQRIHPQARFTSSEAGCWTRDQEIDAVRYQNIQSSLVEYLSRTDQSVEALITLESDHEKKQILSREIYEYRHNHLVLKSCDQQFLFSSPSRQEDQKTSEDRMEGQEK